MTELQKLIKEAQDYEEDIENMHEQIAFLQIQIQGQENYTEHLLSEKERLDDQKKLTDEQNEDLDRQVKAKDEATHKRLIAKIQRDRNAIIKDLQDK